MKSHVQEKLERMTKYPFFEKVGTPLPHSVTKVNSWPRAGKECGSRKWGNCQLMARNALQGSVEKLFKSNPMAWHRLQEWEPLGKAIGPLIEEFTKDLVRKTSIPIALRAKVANDLEWDIFFICLEAEFSDLVHPFFYLPLLDPWYAAGHFPCGWDGEEFPNGWDGIVRGGQLMVF